MGGPADDGHRSQDGAEKGKHAKDRKTHFSGARVRRMDTRLGTPYLNIPKHRKGGYVPFFVTEKKRSELALIALIQEVFINGVSMRRIGRLAQALGIDSISACHDTGLAAAESKKRPEGSGSFGPGIRRSIPRSGSPS